MLEEQLVKKLNVNFSEFLSSEGLVVVDEAFLAYLKTHASNLAKQMLNYRENSHIDWPATELSQWVMQLAPYLEAFIIDLFAMEEQAAELRAAQQHDTPIFAFKQYFVLRLAKRRLKDADALPEFTQLNAQLLAKLNRSKDGEDTPQDLEWVLAEYAQQLLADESEQSSLDQELLVQWCVQALSSNEGQAFVADWASFKLPKRLNFNKLVNNINPEGELGCLMTDIEYWRERQGFSLTDKRMNAREVAAEIHYCVYCHEKEDDFCRQGFPVKKGKPELGFKQNLLKDDLTGCPLEQKISEMHALKRGGWSIGALATMMIDNPMCPLTGHRICNDCMKACIYQKQDPVDIPQTETRILTDVLGLPWGVEIYHLLVRWNPLRQQQWIEQPYQGYKNLIVGLGPAGITLAHHLLMEGVAVLAVDGLKLEPLPSSWVERPIESFSSICTSLEERPNRGFGGVAEYGITVRWDKNFLQLVYLSMSRRRCFQAYGGVRFGGTLEVADAWRLGFHHLAVAVGAGLPRELAIPNSLAPGMRSANDFLMTLQSTSAYQWSSLAHIQVRLPALVIGGGLTAIDTATELQAYYIRQVEKVAYRYHTLATSMGEVALRRHFVAEELELIDEMLTHAKAIQLERAAAQAEERDPALIKLIHQWGGVSIVYRRTMQQSPAYQRNYQEITKALEEGILYLENFQPIAARLDEHGHVSALICEERIENEQGQWIVSDHDVRLPAKSIMIATGAQPNIAYEYEHRGTFKRGQRSYQPYQLNDHGQLTATPEVGHCKTQPAGILTSYQNNGDYRVSFIGDTHPLFHGSVVKAMASAKQAYPSIMQVMPKQAIVDNPVMDYQLFFAAMAARFTTQVISLKRLTAKTCELIIRAPQACFKHQPGQFYRLQSHSSRGKIIGNTRLGFAPIAAMGLPVEDQPGCLSFAIQEEDVPLRLLSRVVSRGKPIALMGPTGARSSISANKTVVIIGGELAIPYVLSVAKAMKAQNNRLVFIGLFSIEQHIYWQPALEAVTERIVWSVLRGTPVLTNDTNVSLVAKEKTTTGQLKEALAALCAHIPEGSMDEAHVIGPADLLRAVKCMSTPLFTKQTRFIASVYGPMQCMLKGVCAQCLQWQIDPETGARTKAVYACSWQHQPMEQIDMHHLEQRCSTDKTQSHLNRLWINHILGESI